MLRQTIKSIYNEIFGEPVDRPIIARGLAFVVDLGLLYGLNLFIVFMMKAIEGGGGLNFVLLFSASMYFTLGNSKLYYGQTLGKRVCRICVVGNHGEYLDLKKSLIRSLPVTLLINDIGIFYYFWYYLEDHPSYLMAFNVFRAALYIGVCLFAFTPTRQGLQDFMVGSHVQKISRARKS